MTALTRDALEALAVEDGPALQDPSAYVVERAGRRALEVLVTGARCGGCISKIEGKLLLLPGVEAARLNLSTGRLAVEWRGGLAPKRIIEAVIGLGFGASAFDQGEAEKGYARTERNLLIALAVAGFAAGNVMLLSVSVWAGTDMSLETRTLLHWVSALIAIPAALYAGQPFFRSAIASIAKRRLNMDVPISLAVLLALGLSIYQTIIGGEHAYYDAAVTLLFFLLIGRVLDARLRRRAYAAANALAALGRASAIRLRGDTTEPVRVADIVNDDVLVLAAGERLSVDAEVIAGESAVDLRLVTGEIEPVSTWPGQRLYAGAVNGSGPLRVRALAPADQSLMADVARLLEAGEQKKSSYRRIADKAAEAYVPRVHAMAALGFLGWLVVGAGLPKAVFIAASVLIITCPCALALAAPLVQVVAAGRLFKMGAYLASGDALERLATVDHVVFDKTGTLTLGDPVLREEGAARNPDLLDAARLARASRHPFARALARAAGPGPIADELLEHPGGGMSGMIGGRSVKFGSAAFVGAASGPASTVWFRRESDPPTAFEFDEVLRPDARDTIDALRAMNITAELISGDGEDRVARAAAAAGLAIWTAAASPVAKAERLKVLEASGKKVLMVGDGLNDAGALAGAHASLAPGGAVDVARLAADCVFSGDSLVAVVGILKIARTARRRMRENFGFAAVYNLLAVPVALFGFATPMIAAIAMSASSAIVTLNALRLARSNVSSGVSV